MSDLEQRIARLEAAEGVRELLWRYTNAIDRLEVAEDLADCFTPGAVMVNPTGRRDGRDAILEHYEGVLSANDHSQHYVVNSVITMEGLDRARHRSYFLVLMSRDGVQSIVRGAYDDVVVRGADGTWRFETKGNDIRGATPLAAPVQIEE